MEKSGNGSCALYTTGGLSFADVLSSAVLGAALHEQRQASLDQKIMRARATIARALETATAPRLLCSFGKDSLVMVHLLAEFGVHTVLYLEDTDEVIDREHMLQVVDRYGLVVVPMAKGRSIFYVTHGVPMLLSFPFVNRQHMLPVPTNVTPYMHGDEFVCIDDELRATHGTTVEDDGDLMFLGQKISDIDVGSCTTLLSVMPRAQVEGYKAWLASQGFHYDIAPGLPACAPLKFWTDADVWAFIERYDVPWSRRMYHDGKRIPHPHVCCYRCHDTNGLGRVHCPKLGRTITNLRHFAPDTDLELERMRRIGLITCHEKSEVLDG